MFAVTVFLSNSVLTTFGDDDNDTLSNDILYTTKTTTTTSLLYLIIIIIDQIVSAAAHTIIIIIIIIGIIVISTIIIETKRPNSCTTTIYDRQTRKVKILGLADLGHSTIDDKIMFAGDHRFNASTGCDSLTVERRSKVCSFLNITRDCERVQTTKHRDSIINIVNLFIERWEKKKKSLFFIRVMKLYPENCFNNSLLYEQCYITLFFFLSFHSLCRSVLT